MEGGAGRHPQSGASMLREQSFQYGEKTPHPLPGYIAERARARHRASIVDVHLPRSGRRGSLDAVPNASESTCGLADAMPRRTHWPCA